MPRTVVITGGIGSGKSALCSYLSSKGIPVYDSDSRTKSLYDREPWIVRRLEEEFGCSLRDGKGRLDRRSLAAVVFSDPARLSQLESVVYPVVLQDFKDWRERYPEADFVVLESAVILSKPIFDGIADRVVLVDAPEALRIRRAAQRDGRGEESVRERAHLQHFDLSKVDAVLVNDGTLSDLFRKADALFAHLFDE